MKEGADAWYSSAPSRFLGNDYNPDDYEQVKDIVDVWFDSGSTHAFVLEQNRADPTWDMHSPADLYLEGSDQHRGWFHSSLLESCRHARACALQGGADPRLRHGRAGPQDVEVAGQRHRPAEGDGAVRRRHPAPVGRHRPTMPTTSASATRS
jgi:hypothetical protein